MVWRQGIIASVLLALGACVGAAGDDDFAPSDERDASIEPATSDERDASVLRDARVPDARVPDARVVASDAQVVATAPDARVVETITDARVPDAGSTTTNTKASWLIQPGDKVFFVGNSFFGAYDRVLPAWVEALGQQSKFEIDTGSHLVPGNKRLSWFFDQQQSQDAIASGQWDVFVIQGEDTEPVDAKDEFFNAVRDYHQAVTAKGGKLMLFMTWDWEWNGGPDSAWFQKLAAAYDEIGEELNIPVIPVGQIFNDCEKAPYPGESTWFLTENTSEDHLHQTVEGSAITAYATFSMLTGIDAMGADIDVASNTNTPEMLKYLSDKSWARVSERLK